jgi:hypothetical protein
MTPSNSRWLVSSRFVFEEVDIVMKSVNLIQKAASLTQQRE